MAMEGVKGRRRRRRRKTHDMDIVHTTFSQPIQHDKHKDT